MRFKLYEYAIQLLNKDTYETNMDNIRKLAETERYRNWYLGTTYIDIPTNDFLSKNRGL